MDKSSQNYLLNQHPSIAPSAKDFSLDGNATFISDQHPSSAPSSNEININEQQTDASLMIRNMAFLWLALLALYYVCGPRRSQVTIDQRVVHERLRQLREAEIAKKRRLNPDKRKEEINEQIMTGIIEKFDAAKFRLAGLKKKELYPPAQTCLSCSSDKDEEVKATEESNVAVKGPPIPRCTDGDIENGIKPSSCDIDDEIQSSCEMNTSTQPEEDSDVDMECSVCLEVFEAGDKLSWSRNLKCEHVFHQECLMPWLMTHDECPYCRTKIIDDCCDTDKAKENIEAIIYSDFPSVDNVDSNEESPVDDNVFRKLKCFVRRSIGYFQPPQRVTRIDNERNGTMMFQEYFMDF